jgi:hypothetical protein
MTRPIQTQCRGIEHYNNRPISGEREGGKPIFESITVGVKYWEIAFNAEVFRNDAALSRTGITNQAAVVTGLV